MNLKSTFHTIIKVFLPLLLGCLLLWFLYRNMDISEIWQVIKTGVDYRIILFCPVVRSVCQYGPRVSLGLLIHSLGEKFRMSNVVYAVLGNYAVNLVLPRVGEVWRCGMITKYEKISFPKLLGTLLIDRVSDTIMVGLITLSIFIFNIEFFISFFRRNPDLIVGFQSMFHSIWIYAFLVIIVFAVWFCIQIFE